MTELIEMKTADLTGEALNWSVAKALGLDVYLAEPHYGNAHRVMVRYTPEGCQFEQEKRFQPSTDWGQIGPLLVAHGVSIDFRPISARWDAYCKGWINDCETAPIAACRAIVASVLGDTVSVPKELIPE